MESNLLTVDEIDLYNKKIRTSSISSLINVEVVEDKDNNNDENVKVFSPIYPSSWFSSILISPFGNKIEEETINWMKNLNLINTKHAEDIVRKVEPRYYAGYSLPLANYDYALIFCKFII
jgi:hypothetical protein